MTKADARRLVAAYLEALDSSIERLTMKMAEEVGCEIDRRILRTIFSELKTHENK